MRANIKKVQQCIEVNGYVEFPISGVTARVRRIRVAKNERGWKNGTWVTDHMRGLSGYVGFSRPDAKQAITAAAVEQLEPANVERRAEERKRATQMLTAS